MHKMLNRDAATYGQWSTLKLSGLQFYYKYQAQFSGGDNINHI